MPDYGDLFWWIESNENDKHYCETMEDGMRAAYAKIKDTDNYDDMIIIGELKEVDIRKELSFNRYIKSTIGEIEHDYKVSFPDIDKEFPRPIKQEIDFVENELVNLFRHMSIVPDTSWTNFDSIRNFKVTEKEKIYEHYFDEDLTNHVWMYRGKITDNFLNLNKEY